MTGVCALWLPILLSSVAVFIVSSVIHMVMPWHKKDYGKVPNEDNVMDQLRSYAIPPGDYMMPQPSSMREAKSPEYIEKRKKGPVLILSVLPNGMVSMTPNLIQWFIYTVIINIFSAYIASRALPMGGEYLQVFRFIGTSAFMGYSFSVWQMSIWYGRSWRTTVTTTLDGLIYALLTAGIFGWLWPL